MTVIKSTTIVIVLDNVERRVFMKYLLNYYNFYIYE